MLEFYEYPVGYMFCGKNKPCGGKDVCMETKMEIRISVRNLVEFVLRSGDIDNRRSGASDNAMQEGSRISAGVFSEIYLGN